MGANGGIINSEGAKPPKRSRPSSTTGVLRDLVRDFADLLRAVLTLAYNPIVAIGKLDGTMLFVLDSCVTLDAHEHVALLVFDENGITRVNFDTVGMTRDLTVGHDHRSKLLQLGRNILRTNKKDIPLTSRLLKMPERIPSCPCQTSTLQHLQQS